MEAVPIFFHPSFYHSDRVSSSLIEENNDSDKVTCLSVTPKMLFVMMKLVWIVTYRETHTPIHKKVASDPYPIP